VQSIVDVVVGSGVEDDSICHATSPLGGVAATVVAVSSRLAQHFRFFAPPTIAVQVAINDMGRVSLAFH